MILQGHDRLVKIQEIITQMREKYDSLISDSIITGKFYIIGYKGNESFIVALNKDTFSINKIKNDKDRPTNAVKVDSIVQATGRLRNILMKSDFEITKDTHFSLIGTIEPTKKVGAV